MREKQLETALAFVLILLIVAWATESRVMLPWIVVAGFILGAFPWVLSKFYTVWTALLSAVHFVVSKLVLSAIFLLVVTPLGFFVRRSRKRTLVLKNKGRDSLLVSREKVYNPADLDEPW